MAEYIINLTSDEDNAFVEMLGSGIDIESYLKSIASSHIKQKLDEEWNNLTDAEKQAKLAE